MTTIVASDQICVQITRAELQKSADTCQWFTEEINIPLQALVLLEQYASLTSEEVIPHVSGLRSRAFKPWPYPCIGQMMFLDLTTSKHPDYTEVVRRLKHNQTYLDAGCCLGQDIRKLLYDGAPSSAAMYGIDVEPAFSDLGYELFRDRNRLNVTFIAANLTQMSTPSLKTLQESFDIISVQNLFHLFNLEVQKTVARYLVSLIKPIAGSLIFGLQVGSTEGKEVEGLAKGTSAFAHSVETWAKFWHDIGETTNSKWHVRVHADETPEWFKRQRWGMSSMVIIVFTAVRQQWVLSSESQWYAD